MTKRVATWRRSRGQGRGSRRGWVRGCGRGYGCGQEPVLECPPTTTCKLVNLGGSMGRRLLIKSSEYEIGTQWVMHVESDKLKRIRRGKHMSVGKPQISYTSAGRFSTR